MFGLGSRDVLRVRVCDIKYDCLSLIDSEEIQREDMAHNGRIHAQMAARRENEPEEQRSPTYPHGIIIKILSKR
jgi:hypothetical protein